MPEMSESEYDKAIDIALDSARHFIVVITKLKQLDKRWIKYEIDTFIREEKEGRKENANFIILVTDELYNEIIKTNKKCLPIALRGKEIITKSRYQDKLLSYICKF